MRWREALAEGAIMLVLAGMFLYGAAEAIQAMPWALPVSLPNGR